MSNKYNILITPSSEYCHYTFVLMLSAILNCKLNCHFYIMQCDWTNEQKTLCEDIVAEYPGNDVTFIDISEDIFSTMKPYVTQWHGSNAIFYKLLAHKYLPDSVERILYLDVDVIINKDIKELYNIDFDGKLLYASLHPIHITYQFNDYEKKAKKGGTWPNYFVSGCLLMNIKKFRQENIDEDFYTARLKAAGYAPVAVDEGVMNLCFFDKTKLFAYYKYNYMLGYKDNFKEVYKYSKENYTNLNAVYHNGIDEEKKFSIIHFVHIAKPWQMVRFENKVLGFFKNQNQAYIDELKVFYVKWWEIAEKLPENIYFAIHMQAVNNISKDLFKLNNDLRYSRNVINFLLALANDNVTNNLFKNFLSFLNGKKLSILSCECLAGRFFTKAAEQYGANIVFSTNYSALSSLAEDEWNKCKQSEVIVCCNVHGAKPVERDGVKPIMIRDILNSSSLIMP